MLFVVTVPLWLPGLALAIDQPDSNPSFSDVRVNRNLITSGDVCVYGKYNIPYATIPTDAKADEAFIFRLIGTDNSTELGSVGPYVYFFDGYNLGVFSFYFESAISANFTWESAYILRISENPALFDAPTYYDYVIPLANTYTSASTQADNQVDMAVRIIAMANDLEAEYTSYTFLEQSAGGTVLSAPTGATYFRGAIPGLQLMAPRLFLLQPVDMDVSSVNWTTDQAEAYQERFDGTWVGASENATAIRFGVERPMLMALGAGLPACLGLIIVSQKKFKKTEPGLIACAIVLILLFVMGWIPTAIFATLNQLEGIYISYLIFYARS